MFSEWTHTKKKWEVSPLTVEKWNKSNGNVYDLYPVKKKKSKTKMKWEKFSMCLPKWRLYEGWKEWNYNISIISWLKPIIDSMELETPALIGKSAFYLISSISPEIWVNLSIWIVLFQYKELTALFG